MDLSHLSVLKSTTYLYQFPSSPATSGNIALHKQDASKQLQKVDCGKALP